MDLLYALQGIRNPVLDVICKIFTTLGEEYCVMIVLCIFAWCFDKKFVYKTGFVFAIGLAVNQILKITFCIKRPWVLDKRIKVSPLAEKSATGYSFPSGHTQSGSITFGMLIKRYKNIGLRTAFGISLLLLAFSRMYFGAHTLLDVSTSLVIGLVLILLSDKMYEWYERHDALTLIIYIALSLFIVLYSLYKPYPSDHDFKLSFDCFKTAGTITGMAVSWFIDKRFLNYKTDGKLPFQIIKTVVGLGLIIMLNLALKKYFDQTQFVVMFVSKFLLVFWGLVIYPIIFNLVKKSCRI